MASVLRRSMVTSSTTKPRVLITGALGQLGSTLGRLLRQRYGSDNVVSADVRVPPAEIAAQGPFVYVDVLNYDQLAKVVVENRINWVVHFSALLSAVGEKNPKLALDVNITGFQNVMDLASKHKLTVFCPSTIGAFGPTTPRVNTPDITIMRPTTIYGITKVHAELLGEWYHRNHGVDFRSLRYPGIISAETPPGGGTTDYAVDIFHHALKTGSYTSFLGPNTRLPMMYIPDCLEGTIQFLETPREHLKMCTYNMSGIDFTPTELADSIRKFIPNLVKKPPPRPPSSTILLY